MIKTTIRFLIWLGTRRDHTYGRFAHLVGRGPCERCVGRALADLPTDDGEVKG
jgi:alkylated DNA nucleotide flippase Atl1